MSAGPTPEQLADWNDDLQPALIGTSIAFLFIGNTSVILRLYSQWVTSRSFRAEDFWILVAVAFADVLIACWLVATHFGMGLHVYRVIAERPYDLILCLKYTWIVSIFHGPMFLAIKLSLLYFYKHVFYVGQKTWLIFWWINLVYSVLWGVGQTIFLLVQCRPASFYWEQWYDKLNLPKPYPISGMCTINTSQDTAIPLILGLIQDTALLIWPMLMLSKLHRSVRRRLALLGVFGCGLLAWALELARIVITEVNLDKSDDPTYGFTDFAIFTYGSAMIGIMCACMPFIASLWRRRREQSKQSRQTPQATSSLTETRRDFWLKRGTAGFRSSERSGGATLPVGTMATKRTLESKDSKEPLRSQIAAATEARSKAGSVAATSESSRPHSDEEEGIEIPQLGEIRVRTDVEWSTEPRNLETGLGRQTPDWNEMRSMRAG